ncbi:sterol carrier family protein [Streptomyces sp. TP-A0874]|uniref:sterol carrier family protein n=1 Tax=Streptomyces sp. TP-A0874 TaxID=549819 RepID=UPI0008538416|nr:sterol carrier family protein [Streptomyces sp. TP-A0874]
MPTATRRPRPRRYDPAKVRAALDAELRAVRGAVAVVCAAEDARQLLQARTRLGSWTVRDLITHLARALEALPRGLRGPSTGERIDLQGYVGGLSVRAAEVADAAVRDSEALPSDEPRAVLERLDAAVVALEEAVAATEGRGELVGTALGVLTVDDFLVTRLLEVVVHGDDLTAATGAAIRHDREALATVTRLLADTLAARAPGGSVELRIPPFAVVQCVEGPRHTRGTPPNVVETEPLTWIRLATGRLPWWEAAGGSRLTASGERADLSELLPVFRERAEPPAAEGGS